MPNLMQDLGTKIGGEFKTHRLRIENVESTKVDKVTSTDNAIVRFNGTTGKVQNSGVIVDDNNNVGIGCIPSSLFQVNQSTPGLNSGIKISHVNIGTGAADGFDLVCDVNGVAYIIQRENADLAIRTNNIERMRIDSNGNVLVTNVGGLGYGTGAGGTVTQLTSKSTAATLNKPSGLIIMHNAALAAGASTSFVVNNTTVVAAGNTADNVVVSIFSGISGYSNYRIQSSTINGGFVITLTNQTGISLSDAVVVKFDVIKGAVA